MAAGSSGCGGADSKLGRVDGVVRLNGKPISAGTVEFLPAAGRAAHGKIQSDGTFTLGTYGDADGALLGMHKVAVVAYHPGKVGRPDPAVRSTSLKPLVPERYLAAGTSNLTFEVKPGDNHAELDLTTP